MLIFLLGMVIGANVGLVVTALCFSASHKKISDVKVKLNKVHF